MTRAPSRPATIVAIYRGPGFVGIAMNPECARVLNGRPMIGLPFAEVFPEAWVRPGIALMQRVYRTGISETIEMANIREMVGSFTAIRLPGQCLLAIVWTPLGVHAGTLLPPPRRSSSAPGVPVGSAVAAPPARVGQPVG